MLTSLPLPHGSRDPRHRLLQSPKNMRARHQAGSNRSGARRKGRHVVEGHVISIWLQRSGALYYSVLTSRRSGVHSQDRRRIEKQMFNGELLGIVATTALELGIDIGSLDAVITLGFPYTLPGLVCSLSRFVSSIWTRRTATTSGSSWPTQQGFARSPHLRTFSTGPTLRRSPRRAAYERSRHPHTRHRQPTRPRRPPAVRRRRAAATSCRRSIVFRSFSRPNLPRAS